MKRKGVALLLVLFWCTGALPATFYVDDDAPGDPAARNPNSSDPQEDGSATHPFDSIQEAIDAAADGDTIIVAPGWYLAHDTWAYAELDFKGKNVRLLGSAPTDFDVINQTVLCGVVVFQGTEDPNCLLQGFKIQNYDYGCILGNKTRARLSHCIISGNGPAGGTVLKDVYGRVSNCLIVDNTTFHDGGVLPVVSGCPELVNCTIANNLSGVEFTHASLAAGAVVAIHNCIIWGNQGPQVIPVPGMGAVDYSLIGNWKTTLSLPSPAYTMQDADPGFVRLGQWGPLPTPSTTSRTPSLSPETPSTPKPVLVEGDYHLRSGGWRWSPDPSRGSNWSADQSTSPAVDAGDPMDSLGEELERIPADPEGVRGINHAVNLGAYGGTNQASLAPSKGETPGAGAVDLRDFWPLRVGEPGNRAGGGPTVGPWCVRDSQGGFRKISMTADHGDYFILATSNAPDWLTGVYCYYVNRTFYMTQNSPPDCQQVPAQVQAQYPLYPVVGATIQVPYDPFTKAPVQYRSVLVVRGTLAEVLVGTQMNRAQILAALWLWPDVIAFKEIKADGTTGDPIAIFARGFGPLLLAGQTVVAD